MTKNEMINSIISLFPKGRYFERWIRDNFYKIETLASEIVLCLDRIEQCRQEIDPRQATEENLLPYWEERFNLNNSHLSLEKRREIIYSKVISCGDQSISFYKNFLSFLGYDVDIKEYPSFKAGDKAGSKLYNHPYWEGRCTIIFKNIKQYKFKAGSKAGEPLVTYDKEHKQIEAILNKMKLSHTILNIQGEQDV